MGFFSRFNEGMNEEFILGNHNVERVRDDPEALQDVLYAQRARGFGSPKILKQHTREVQKLEESSWTERPRGKSRTNASTKAPHRLRRAVVTLAKLL
jgi:hypothetical protein